MGDRRAVNGTAFNVVEFLSDLAAGGVSLWLDGEQLRYHARQEDWTAQIAHALKQHKAEIVAWLREREATQLRYPLSQGQRGLWMAWQMEPDSPTYHVLLVARLRDDVDVETLQRAAQLLLDRHPVLRTVYPADNDGEPLQRVQTGRQVAFEIIDGAGWTQPQIDGWIELQSDRPFDLAQGPIMRMALLGCRNEAGQHGYILHWNIHHVATDFFTQQILLEELNELYRALREGRRPALPVVDLQYRDFVQWETDVLRQQEAQLASFWDGKLGDAAPALNLPPEQTPAAGRTYRGRNFDFQVAEPLAEQLRALARSHQTTLYTVLLAAFQALLNRSNGQPEVLISTPTSVRRLPGFERTVGYLVNPVIVRADLSDDIAFSELLARTRRTVSDAFRHQMYPYSSALRRLQSLSQSGSPARSLVGFVYDQSRRVVTAVDLIAETLAFGQRGMYEDLYLLLFDFAGELKGRFIYNGHRFEESTVARMTEHFFALLKGVVGDPGRPPGRHSLLTEAELHRLLVEWNDTAGDGPRDRCIHQLFEEQVGRTPDAVALVFEERTWSYRELNARANRLAHHLRALGVGPEPLVGICVDRSPELVVGLLAVLKAGGAYIPLDPAYPPQRLALMSEDSQLSVLLTRRRLLDSLPRQKARVVCLDDDDWPGGTRDGNANPVTDVTPDNLAYVIYTSGSTGRPKGVMVCHRNVVNFFDGMDETLRFSEPGTWLAVTSISFDISVLELFWTLARGFKLVLSSELPSAHAAPLREREPNRRAPSDHPIAAQMARHGVTHLQCTPALARLLLAEAETRAALGGLEKMLVGGEALPPNLAAELKEVLTGDLLNMYGPTETTIWSATHPVEQPNRSVPIGRPITNTQVYVLDRHGQPAPVGVAGEVMIGGAGVARGYLKRPGLTAERFVPDPYGKSAGARLYRTGDLAKWTEEGRLEFLGRLDQQVKLRGFRIEPGEIEAALLEHPALREAVVVAREFESGEERLVAYCVAPGIARPAVFNQAQVSDELRRHLQEKLPGQMVPSVFVLLDALPLTPNGKVNHRALPAPGHAGSGGEASYAPPRTPMEEMIVNLWCEVLNLERMSIYSNFFELGGYSLSATRAISRIRKTLGINIPHRCVFDNPTAVRLAEQVEAHLLLEQMSNPVFSAGKEVEEI